MGANNSKPPKITPHDRAVLDLKLQRDRIKQYQRKIQVVLDREYEIARQSLGRGEKGLALIALRRRKYQQGLISKTEGQLEILEGLVSSIEFSQIQHNVMLGLQQGNEVLKQIHSELNLQMVEKLLDESVAAQAYQKEIDEKLTSHMSTEEEQSVQNEFNTLLKETIDIQTESLPQHHHHHQQQQQQQMVVELPTPPKTFPLPIISAPKPNSEQYEEYEQREEREECEEPLAT